MMGNAIDEKAGLPSLRMTKRKLKRFTENSGTTRNVSIIPPAYFFMNKQSTLGTPGTTMTVTSIDGVTQGQDQNLKDTLVPQQLTDEASIISSIKEKTSSNYFEEQVPLLEFIVATNGLSPVVNALLSALLNALLDVIISRSSGTYALSEATKTDTDCAHLRSKDAGSNHVTSITTKNGAPELSHNGSCEHLVHLFPSHLTKVFQVLMGKLHKIKNSSKHTCVGGIPDIFIEVQKDQSVTITSPTARMHVHIEAAAAGEIADKGSITGDKETTTENCFEEQFNEWLDSRFSASFSVSGYIGDVEDEREATDGNGNVNRKFRKKFGVYPAYRIRLNGVRYITLDSSDEDELDDCLRLPEQAYRESRKSRKGNKWSKLPEPILDSVSSSEDKGSGEESEPVVVHIVSTRKKKLPSKRRVHAEDVDTTASEASDVESLTDCSLCCGYGSP